MDSDGITYPRSVTAGDAAKSVVKSVSGYVVSAPWRSSGKTLVTLGLARAATRQAIAVRTFKKGPDYIDPLWLAAASRAGCYNLDPYVQCEEELVATFHKNIDSKTLALIEGTMGLHDGLCNDGSDSNAAIARLLNLAIILVVDCTGMHRTVASLINGIQHFDPRTRFAGIILNRIKSSRHEGKIRTAIDEYCDTHVIGAVPDCRSIHIDEQELGLTPAPEFNQTASHNHWQQMPDDCPANLCIESAADMVIENCDLTMLYPAAQSQASKQRGSSAIVNSGAARRFVQTDTTAALNTATTVNCVAALPNAPTFKIGIAKDEAFHFYYQDDLDRLQERGVQLIDISPIRDVMPDDLDGLIMGGGFPERHAKALSDNLQFRHALLLAINQGLVVHAECAGLMYLCRSLQLDSGNFAMTGCFAADVTMGKKPVGRGYMQLQAYATEGADRAADASHDALQVIHAHEFHHSRITFDTPCQFTYCVLRGYGVDGHNDGVQYKNVHASYAHFRHTRSNPWLDVFLQRVNDASKKPYNPTDAIRKQLRD